jgi:hypothetical protein
MTLSLLDIYQYYHKMKTIAPGNYGNHLCIQFAGHSLGVRSSFLIQPSARKFNSYIALIGVSGGSKKTTSQEAILKPLIPQNHLGPNSFSPEGLLRVLEEQSWLICNMGEMSTLLRSINKGGNLSNFKEISNDLLSCPNVFRKPLANSENNYEIQNPYLSLNTTCTPEEFFANLNREMVYGGFLPRYLICYEEKPERKPRTALPECAEPLENLLRIIFERMYNFFGTYPISLKFSEPAEIEFEKISKDLEENPIYADVQPFVSRYEDYLISYSGVLFVLDGIGRILQELGLSELTELSVLSKLSILSNAFVHTPDSKLKECLGMLESPASLVSPHFVREAWLLIKPCLEYALKISRYVDEDLLVARVCITLDKLPAEGKIGWTEALIKSKLSAKLFAEAISTLQERGWTIITIEQPEGRDKKFIKKTQQYGV